jgi:hypothetical protein
MTALVLVTFYEFIKFDGFVKNPFNVIPAKAGIQKRLKTLDSAKASLRARPAPE